MQPQLMLCLALWCQRSFQALHCQTEWVVSMEPRNPQDPWPKRVMSPMWYMQIAPDLVFFCGPRCHTSSFLLSLGIGSCVERSPKRYGMIPIPLEPLHLSWMKSALHPSLGHQQMHPAAAHSFLSALGLFCLKTLLQQSWDTGWI